MRELKHRESGTDYTHGVAPSRVRELKQNLKLFNFFDNDVAPSRVRELKLRRKRTGKTAKVAPSRVRELKQAGV